MNTGQLRFTLKTSHNTARAKLTDVTVHFATWPDNCVVSPHNPVHKLNEALKRHPDDVEHASHVPG